jgi:WXG100 family type VII secretion target
MRYRVELDGLLGFVDKLEAFEQRAEAIANRVDDQVAELHSSWDGHGASGHLTQHQDWIAAARQMREALAHLKATAHNAHRNYTEAIELNVAMLT